MKAEKTTPKYPSIDDIYKLIPPSLKAPNAYHLGKITVFIIIITAGYFLLKLLQDIAFIQSFQIKYLFWLSFFFIFYTYLGYPCVLFFWSNLSPKKVKNNIDNVLAQTSVIVAARNEEQNIKDRLENLFSQNYPPEKLEIIIVSDGSTDNTNKIVEEFIEKVKTSNKSSIFPKLQLITIKTNKGKPNALNLGIQVASGEYIVFTDARQKFENNTIKQLISNFSDPSVGCVSGELLFCDSPDSCIEAEMGFYWNLEKKIRKMESEIHSCVGATGAIYAIRKELFSPIPETTLLDDVLIPMNIVLKGYRVIFDSMAVAYDSISEDFQQEKRRKVRTLSGNYQLIKIRPDLIFPKRNPIFFRFLSHKIFRLFVPFFFILFLFSSIFSDGLFYQISFFCSALIIFLSFFKENKLLQRVFIDRIMNFTRTFLMLNYFAFLAPFYFWGKNSKNLW